jgi:hypothetical protein
MVAIITDAIKRQFIQEIYDDLSDSAASRYYVAVAKSEDWNDSDIPVDPANTDREARNFRLGMQAIKRITDYSFTVPRYNWSFGTTYSAYNDNTSGYPTIPYYVLTEDNAVYICLKQAKTDGGIAQPSTVKPSGTLTREYTAADGYIWKFLYTIGTLSATKFLTANYMPVQKILTTDSDSLAVEIEQKAIQDAAIPGQVIGLRIVNGGAGYDDAPVPTITIVGNGTTAQGLTWVTGGVITKVEMDESDGEIIAGSGYSWAEAVISGGSPTTAASVLPILSPKNGFGADPRIDLKATAIMFNVIPDSDENGEWVIGNSFRQLGILKNPKVGDISSDSDYIAAAGNTLRGLRFASVSTAFTVGSTIQGATSSAKALVDKISGTGSSTIIYYHQSEATGFTQFQEAEAITELSGLPGSGILKAGAFDADSRAYDYPSADPFSGELLYIDNRAKIDRDEGQAEDIKIIIQL